MRHSVWEAIWFLWLLGYGWILASAFRNLINMRKEKGEGVPLWIALYAFLIYTGIYILFPIILPLGWYVKWKDSRVEKRKAKEFIADLEEKYGK